MSVSAHITNISRCSVHDGPGIRTVVYIKGCGLRCRWCHNPETLSPAPQILYAETKCIHCGRCINVCPDHHTVVGDRMVYVREGCTGCGRCADACPSGALSLAGEKMSVEEVFRAVMKDKPYFDESGGGITVSGGECLLQPDFVAELLRKCRESGIHTAIETALAVPYSAVTSSLPYVSLIFADLKLPDADGYRAWCGHDGVDYSFIFENLRKITREGIPVILRIPVIPGVNDGDETLRALGDRIASLGPDVQSVELLRYNPLGESKYILSGKPFTSFAESPQSSGRMEEIRRCLMTRTPPRIPVTYL